MLRNRRKNVRKKNARNRRNRNEFIVNTDEDDSGSDCWEPVPLMSELDSDEENSSNDVSSTRRRPVRKTMKPKTKRNATKRKPVSNATNDANEAGPSGSSGTSNCSRVGLKKGTAAKRKLKERKQDLLDSDSSSDDIFGRNGHRSNIKRPRTSDLDSDDSDSSGIRPVSSSSQRLSLFSSDSSSSSGEIGAPVRGRNFRAHVNIWSDSESSNTLDQSSHSPIFNTARFRAATSGSSLGTSLGNLLSIRLMDAVASSSSMSSAGSNSSSSTSISSSSTSSSSSSTSTSSSSTFASNSTFSEASDHFMGRTAANVRSPVQSTVAMQEQLISSDSDSSDSDGEKCAICLKKFRRQRVGNPSNCDHKFCVTCIQEWSKSSTTCPVDRSVFDAIIVRNEIDGPVVDRIEVQSRNFAGYPFVDLEEFIMNESIACEICMSGDDEETLLLCDLCNLGYHMACLNPPLDAIPAGSWYCPPCSELHSVNRNLDEMARHVLNVIPLNRLAMFSPRGLQTSARTVRARPMAPLPRGRGPMLSRRSRTHSIAPTFTSDMIASVLRSHLGNQNTVNASNSSVQSARQRIKSRKRNRRRARPSAQVSGIRVEMPSRRISARSDDIVRRTSLTRPGAAVEMVFPSFNLFDNDADYFSEEDDAVAAMEGEVAIMARVRTEYSARRIENRKNMVSSILNDYGNRASSPVDVPEVTPAADSSVSLLDSILESQTLWHSKNVEITSQKDGKLEVKLKNEANKPDLTNTNHTSKKIPLYPNKNNSPSDGNKSYSNNSRYSNNLGNSSAGGSNSFPLSSSSFTSLNPSTRPGFSNILGNSSSALDLSPFRGTTPIRFRMNPPRSALRRQNFNANSMRLPAGPNSALNLSQSPRKGNSGGGEEDVDLYDDIESENVESDKINEGFSSLEPPPEPPALLIGSDSSSDEDNGLVIDDKVAHAANKSNIYDPTEPNEDSDIDANEDRNSSIVPGYLRSPSYGGLSEFGPHLPLPEPPALPIELGYVDCTDDEDEDEDDEAEAECPNMTLYSSTSIISLANNVQDIPVPPSQPDDLDCIPVPNPPPGDAIPLPDEQSSPAKPKEPPPPLPQSAAAAPSPPARGQLYSPSAEHEDSDSSDLVEEVPVTSTKELPKRRPRRRSSSSASSLDSTDENDLSTDDEGGRRSDDSDDYESKKDETSKKATRTSVSDSCRRPEATITKKVSPIEADETVDLTETKDSTAEPSKDLIVVDDGEAPEKAESETAEVSADVEKPDDKDEEDKDDKDEGEGVAVERTADTSVEDEDEAAKVATEVEPSAAAEAKKSDVEDETPKDEVAENGETDANKESAEVVAANTCLLPSDDLDPVSDVEYNDFTDYHKSTTKDRRKKRKKTKKREHSVESTASLPGKSGEARELEEGEIAEDKTKRKFSSAPRKARRSRSLSVDRFDKKLSKRRNRRKAANKENKDALDKGKEGGSSWKKLSKSTKDRNYRDGKARSSVAEKRDAPAKSKELRSKKEKRKEIERYDVRKIVSEKPARPVRDEFGRDISQPRSRSRSRSPRLRSRSRTRSRSVSVARSYNDRRRSKGPFRRSFSQDDRLIDWSPMWTQQQQRRSRSRTRRTRSRSRNRSRLSGDRYRNRSKNRDRPFEKRGGPEDGGRRKRRRSLSSNVDRYSPLPQPAHEKKRRRSKEHQQQRMRKSTSYTNLRHHGGGAGAPAPEYFYEQRRSWSPNVYASMTPEPEGYVPRYDRSPPPSMMDGPPNARLAVVSPDPDIIQVPSAQNLTVIVPNVDAGKKKHKKKKDGKKKKKKQPSKEVFTSGDNIVVSVNFDDNQKIISAKSSKRKHDEGRKKKRDETRRKKRKQTLHVSDEVLNAKPVAVIDLNTSPCKEMSPTEVISLTDSGDEANANEGVGGGSINVISVVRRTSPQQYEGGAGGNEVAQTPDGLMSYVMTSAGPKTPPEPHIKFTVGAGAQMRPLPNNPIFEQDEELENEEEQLRYNKGPNTPPEPLEQQRRRSDSPGATMYDPFEPTKSRSPSPVPSKGHYDKSGKDGGAGAAVVIDMFADDPSDKGGADGGAGGEASGKKSDADCVDGKSPAVKTADEASQTSKTSPPTKEASAGSGDGAASSESTQQTNGMNTLVLDLSSLGDDFVPRSSVPLIKTSQGKYEFQSSKTTDKPVTVVIAPQSSTTTPVKPQPQQVMVTPTRQLPMKPVEPIKQPIFPDILPWKLPPPISSQPSFAVPSTMVSSVAPTMLNASKNMPGMLLNQNGGGGSGAVDDTIYELDESPYSPASSEGDELFEPPPLGSNAGLGVSPKVRGPPAPVPAVNSYKSRVDALFNSSPAKKLLPRPGAHGSRSYPAFKTTAKKATKTVAPSKKEPSMKADEEQLKILDDVPNSAVEMIVKEKFLKKLHRQERVVEEVKVVLKPHYAKKHITKEEYKDILRKAVPKICHNKSGDINPSKIQGLVEAYVRKIRHSKKKKPSNTLPLPGSTGAPLFPSMSTAKTAKKQKTLWS